MKSFLFNRTRSSLLVFMLAVVTVCLVQAKPDNKLTPTDIIAKHLESIGSAEARAQPRNEDQRNV